MPRAAPWSRAWRRCGRDWNAVVYAASKAWRRAARRLRPLAASSVSVATMAASRSTFPSAAACASSVLVSVLSGGLASAAVFALVAASRTSPRSASSGRPEACRQGLEEIRHRRAAIGGTRNRIAASSVNGSLGDRVTAGKLTGSAGYWSDAARISASPSDMPRSSFAGPYVGRCSGSASRGSRLHPAMSTPRRRRPSRLRAPGP